MPRSVPRLSAGLPASPAPRPLPQLAALVLAGCAVLLPALCVAQSPEPPAATPGAVREAAATGVLIDRIAAVVNDGVVLTSDLDQQVAIVTQRLQEAGQQLPPRNLLRQQVLERLVLQEIQMQRANRLGIKVTDEMLNQALEDVARRNRIKFSDLPAALEAQGIDYRDYRDDMRREMTLTLLRQRDVLGRIFVSPRELDQCMARLQANPGESTEYDLQHILIAIPENATPQQVQERTSRAEGIYERARKGEDFGQLAISYSDAGTALEGGVIGWRKTGQLPSFAADAVQQLQAGGVTEPIRTPSGFHLFKVRELRSGQQAALVSQVHARHILLKTNEVEDDQTVRQRLAKIRERVLAGESFEAIASVTSQDPGSAANAGDLGWVGPGTFVPEFERQLDALAENEISEPFKTQYGWHIVQLLGRRTYDASGDVSKNRCFAQLRESKVDEETELWLRRLRDEAFVEYRL